MSGLFSRLRRSSMEMMARPLGFGVSWHSARSAADADFAAEDDDVGLVQPTPEPEYDAGQVGHALQE